MEPKTPKIDDVEYIRKDSVKSPPIEGNLKIVILQRGWVMIGYFKKVGSVCTLTNAASIRRWGTTGGLGQLAAEGPQRETKLDKCYGIVEFDWFTVVASISCEESKWTKSL